MRLADKFTVVRIVYAPVFMIAFWIAAHLHEYALCILSVLTVFLIFAEITDYLDGNTARRLNQVSKTGTILDPFADALLHLTIFFCLAWHRVMPALAFILIFYREFGMLFLRLYATTKNVNIAARMGGKLKTVLYIITCFWNLAVMIYRYTGFDVIPGKTLHNIDVASLVLFIICVVASYVSFLEYIYRWVRRSSENKAKGDAD